jgi:myo-inositol 2-dehydrogenase/D-chiro-inositol 1-dehydrogenase
MMEKIRIGFIGTGRHAKRILYPSLRYASIELVATASLEEDEAAYAAMTFGAKRYYVGHKRLLESEKNLDAVIIAVAPPNYYEIIQDVLSLGLPIFSEKPAAASAEEAAKLEAAARKAGKPIQVGFMRRFARTSQMAQEAMKQKDFGRPTCFVGKFAVGPGLYPDEYTYIVDNPIHMIDLTRSFMGEVEKVSVERTDWGNLHFSYVVLFRFTSGAVGTVYFSNNQSWRQHNEFVEITGEGSFITIDNVMRYQYFPPDGPRQFWEPNYTVPSDQNQSFLLTGYANELQHFVDVVRDGTQPLVTIHDARRVLELIDEIYIKGGGILEPGRKAKVW